jgi:hypothetical protein
MCYEFRVNRPHYVFAKRKYMSPTIKAGACVHLPETLGSQSGAAEDSVFWDVTLVA